MSDSTVAVGVVPPNFPTSDQTEAGIDDVAAGRNKDATSALTELARAVIRAVREIDLATNVSAYLNSLTIHCDGPGMFRLDIDDRNSQVDQEAVANALQDELARIDYHKPLRTVVLEEGTGL